jgi:hypothetical protein
MLSFNALRGFYSLKEGQKDAKRQKKYLLQTPGIEPGTVCAANGAYVATIVRQKS